MKLHIHQLNLDCQTAMSLAWGGIVLSGRFTRPSYTQENPGQEASI
jgi:hypothetical protein